MLTAERSANSGLATMALIWTGERLREIRKAAGLSQTELGAMLDTPIGQAAIGHWETGLHKPDSDRLFQLADALGVSCEVFRQPVGTPFRMDGRLVRPHTD
jgi:transcriptional regulator with XRE-family HTH domain